MKWILLIIFSVGLTSALVWQLWPKHSTPENPPLLTQVESETEIPMATVIAENLTIPWELLFLPDGEMLVTERPGRVVLLREGKTFQLPGIKHVGEGGLLGATLHPDFINNRYIYFYQTSETSAGIENQIVRYTLSEQSLDFDRIILGGIPGAWYHDGGRLAFGPDEHLYATVGDATSADSAQDTSTLAGSIIRLTDEGNIPTDNPITNSYIYSYGHRNPQGLAWDDEGRLWSSEHGRSVGVSGFDEINLITPTGNYGWPDSQGDDVASGTIAPVRHSTASITWAPGGLAYFEGSLFMPGLRGQTLYQAVLNGENITEFKEHLVGEYGRLRTVVVGPDQMLYVLTSNRDGRADDILESDDRIIRINPSLLD